VLSVIVTSSHCAAPSIPTNLSAQAVSYDLIEITWKQVEDNGGDEVNNFLLRITEVDTNMVVLDGREFPASQRSFRADGLKNNTEYRCQLVRGWYRCILHWSVWY